MPILLEHIAAAQEDHSEHEDHDLDNHADRPHSASPATVRTYAAVCQNASRCTTQSSAA